ncbi:MAG TPA: tRNA pseudouridine(55) synthase TruB [Xanthobacteraceae bacterium]|nr:tRNA pseudouridine(55) synthase TruB [Xanthobacteraceae bacterium]
MKAEKRDLHGWLVLDKPVGQTSTDAVAAVKRITRAKKAGHAGTLDPLASGILPIALGEATKTVSFVMDGRKIYRFSVRWGAETDTDDADGTVQRTSDTRPSAEEIKAALPAFTGLIEQVPPRYSALKIEGERAYDLAREGAVVDLAARPVEVHRLTLMEVPDADHSVLEAECGKGTYVRALARDLGRTLGCFGHVAALRRTRVGPFDETQVTSLQRLAESAEAGTLEAAFMPVATALAALPALKVSRAEADRLALGQSVLVRGRDAPLLAGIVSVSTGEGLVALAEMHEGALKPKRIFNLPR